MRCTFFVLLTFSVFAADYTAPAGVRPPQVRVGAESVLPGGRVVTPLGRSYATGPGAFGLAVSPNGKTLATANIGPDHFSLTVLKRDKIFWFVRQVTPPAPDEQDWRSLSPGAAFESDGALFVSEGESGRVRLIDAETGEKRRVFNVNTGGFLDSYTGDLAFDRVRGVLYVLDQANFRLVAIDVRRQQVIGSVRVGRLPLAIALSADGRKAYVTNAGMFEYKPAPGADRENPLVTGLVFPAFGFPSREAVSGARGETMRGPVDVPGLGDPNAPESNSLAIVNLEDPAAPRLEALVPTGTPFGRGSFGGSSPSGVAATPGAVYVSNAHNDSITVVDPDTMKVRSEIPLRIPGLESLRGVAPAGLAYAPNWNWLLVAEAGINAVGIIDLRQGRVLGHVPTGWFPTRVLVDRDMVYVVNAKGHGTGPNSDRALVRELHQGVLRRGSVTIFPLTAAGEIEKLTAQTFANNGFTPRTAPATETPKAIRHVVLIVKESRTFDETLGDVERASNGPVAADPALARLGRHSNVASPRGGLRQRPILMAVNITPNHHELAARWAFSDNFYADSETSAGGHRWLAGVYPNAWTESALTSAKSFRLPTTAPGRLSFPSGRVSPLPEEQPESGAIWRHLERHGVSFRSYGEGLEAYYLTNAPAPDPLYRNASRDYPAFDPGIPDQLRASRFIAEVERRHGKGGEPFPRFIVLHLPQDRLSEPRPEDGYPYEASYMADNDYALGRILEYLSATPWWREMAVFVTEADSQGGVDHVDSHRTLLFVAGPYAKKNYVSHVNSSFPGLLKTVFRLLGVPPLNLFDAAASDLSDCFTSTPDFAPYRALKGNSRLFDPEQVPGGTAAP